MTEAVHRVAVGATARLVVAVGDEVRAGDELARETRMRRLVKVPLARRLRLAPEIAQEHLTVRRGERVAAGQLLAVSQVGGRVARSPVDGWVLWYSTETGVLAVASVEDGPPTTSPLRGRVQAVDDGAIEISVQAGVVRGVDGSGDPTDGELAVRVGSANEELRPGHVDATVRGKILVGGSRVSPETLSRARAMGAAGVVVGGVIDKELRDFLATEERRLAAGRAGSLPAVFGVLVVEGYGRVSLAAPLFDWLATHHGREAALLGADRALYVYGAAPPPTRSVPPQPGDTVFALRAPHAGATGVVASIQPALRATHAGGVRRIAIVRLSNGRRAAVPVANLERLAASDRGAR